MLMEDNTRTIDEAYSSACTTSNLRMRALDLGTIGDAEVLTAAGWSRSQIGGALLRLHSEYDGTARPRLATPADFLAGTTGTVQQRKQVALAQAQAHNLHETGLMLGRLKALPDVRAQVTLQLTVWKVAEPEEVGVSVLMWWLAPTCHACNGTRWESAVGSKHGARACKACGGTGKTKIPHGEAGKKLACFLEDCLSRARASIGKRLHRKQG